MAQKQKQLPTDNSSHEQFDVSFLCIKNHRIRFGIRKGRNKALPLVVFNGIGATLELLRPLLQALPEQEIITFDIPGTGRSSPPCRLMRLKHYADLADSLLESLGYKEFALMGHLLRRNTGSTVRKAIQRTM